MKKLLLFFVLLGVAFAMDLVGSYSGFINAQKCFPNGDYLYLLDRYSLFAFDITDPSTPVKTDSLVTSGYVLNLALVADYAFLGSGNSVIMLDISDAAHPVQTGSISLGATDQARGVAYCEGYVYISGMNVFKIYEFSAPSTLTEVYSAVYSTASVDAEDDYAAIGVSSVGGGGVWVFDITDPSSPVILPGGPTTGSAVDVDIDGDRIYIADGAEVGIGTGHVLLMLTSALGSFIGTFSSTDGDCQHGCAYNNQYLVANGNDGFILLDWSVPESPAIIDNYALSPGVYAQDANIQYPYIYGVTRNELLVLTSESLIDTVDTGVVEDTIPPVVELLEPFDGTFSACSDQQIAFLITDDESGVNWDCVEMVVDGASFYIGDLYQNGDTLAYISGIWSDGDTISYQLLSISDNAGNPASGPPIMGMFIVDLSPPVIFSFQPMDAETVDTETPEISAVIYDLLSGVDYDEFTISVNGVMITLSDPDLEWDGETLCYIPPSPLEEDFATVCIINAEDSPTYCEPNSIEPLCWTFYIDTDNITNKSIKPAAIELTTSPNPFNSVCRISLSLPSPEDGIFTITDVCGRIFETRLLKDVRSTSVEWEPINAPSGVYRISWNGTSVIGANIAYIK